MFKKETEKKKIEEGELLKCLTEYKGKYKEFEKMTNKSKQGFKQNNKDLNKLTQETDRLNTEKARLAKRLGFADTEEANAQIQEMEAKWEQEKVALTEERDRLKELCAQLQQTIKEQPK